jgi:hypothetical protein
MELNKAVDGMHSFTGSSFNIGVTRLLFTLILFISKSFLDLDIVTLSFIFDNYCLTLIRLKRFV